MTNQTKGNPIRDTKKRKDRNGNRNNPRRNYLNGKKGRDPTLEKLVLPMISKVKEDSQNQKKLNWEINNIRYKEKLSTFKDTTKEDYQRT